MKSSLSFKAVALALAAGSFLCATQVKAGDGENRDAAIGVIGGVISGAIEAEQANEAAAACSNWQNKCEAGKGWACEKFEANCSGDDSND